MRGSGERPHNTTRSGARHERRSSLNCRVASVAAAIAALTLSVPNHAQAFSITQPGFTTGTPLYAVFPEGLYLIQIPQYGVRDSKPSVGLFAETPFFFYQSPIILLGGHLNFQFAPTLIASKVDSGPENWGLYNTYFGAGVSWDIGDGWFVGNRIAGFIPQGGSLAYHYGDIEARVGTTYFRDGTNFTANLIYGNPVQSGYRTAPNAFNLDLTLTQDFGKWQFGAVAFASTDISRPNSTYVRQRQVAVGPLIGYNFGSFQANLKLTTDIAQKNYGGLDRRAWLQFTIPLYTAAPVPVRQNEKAP